MCRHSRRYYFALAERLGMTVKHMLQSIDSAELSEWMAYDRTQDEDWRKTYLHRAEVEASAKQSDEDKSKSLKALFGIR